ncbi:MAG: hypothetical protein DI587_38765 [Variovorax paradoxus]|nr:MAG: hypothetical protein DI583_38765 [Variovorax paradoxus]PZP99127.1 MAG: hypothetical protein DI587_38765 [Variovorax paradoxus]
MVLQLDEPVPPMPQAFIGVRLPGYRDYRVFQVEALSAASDQVTLADPWPAGLPLPGATEDDPAHDTLWCYDFKPTPGYRVRVVGMEPEADLKGARISCVPEGPEFWDYVLNGTYVPAPNGSSLSAALPVASDLQITRSRVKVGSGWEHELSATWDVTGNYDHAQVWAAPAGQPLVLIDSNVYGTRLAWRVPSDQTWSVEVRPFDGLGRMGTIASAIFTDPSVAVGAVVGLVASVETNGVVLRWNTPQDIDSIDYASTRIRMGVAGGTWETATPVFEGKANTCNLGWLQAGTLMFYAVHVNSAGDTSTPMTTSIVILPPAQPVVTGDSWIDQVELRWTPSETTQPLRGYEVRVGPVLIEAMVLTVADAIGYVYTPPNPGTHMFWVTAIDRGGNRSAPGYVELTTLPHIDEAIAELQDGLDDVTAGIIDIDGQIAAINSQLADISGVLDWDAGQTYGDSELVKFDGGLYRSLQDGNTNNSPATSPTWWAKIGDYASLGEAVGALAAQVNYHDTRINQLGDDVEAQAASVTSLTSQVGANTASVSTVSSAVATLTGRVNASYTLSIAAGNKIAGFRVSTDGATADFVILSDRFAWALPDGTGVKYPLVLGTINGVASFGFSGNMYVDGTIQARMVGADQIRATHIRTDEIEARHLKAGSVTADKIAVGISSNLLKNSELVTTTGWTFNNVGGVSIGGLDYPNFFPTGAHALYLDLPSTSTLPSSWSIDCPVEELQRYEFSAGIGTHRCTGHIAIEWINASGSVIGDAAFSNSTAVNSPAGGTSLAAFGPRRFGFAVAPAGATRARFSLWKTGTASGETGSYGFFTQPFFGKAGPYQTVPSNYSPSGQGTLIDASGLSVSRISAISPDLGIMVNGRLVSTDNQMTIDLDNKVIEMNWSGRRVRIDTSGFAFGPTGGAPKLFYNAATDQLTLNGTFTADAINAVSTVNVAGGTVTSMRVGQRDLGDYFIGSPLIYVDITMPAGSTGVVLIGSAEVRIASASSSDPLVVSVVRDGDGVVLGTGRFAAPNSTLDTMLVCVPIIAFDPTPVVGYGRYYLRVSGAGFPATWTSNVGRAVLTATGGKR